ncbi:NAD(P)H-binding protein [Streptomyces actinomycinicus]|uniref:NAD(P)H-binding protein n=1 Tax=Streptomyces actinomycinicus TaxID=1695166 RepID=A0A937JSL6_9ACTN|nr:NAD(P)H-binding protein [Streptomyces actinomycinicus]MBL1087611.1 NAD(P)H-binding protein [Streptomyces actinomycinicus]
MSPRIAVAGATGTVGRHLARLLAGTHDVRALTRSPERAARSGVGGRPVRADFGRRAGLERALEGADALFVATFDPGAPCHDEHLAAAAEAAGVRHVVKLSALAVLDTGAQDLITRWQRDCEQLWQSSGLTCTLLRARAFMSNALGWAGAVRAGEPVRTLHGDTRNACVDPADVAGVAARALTVPGHQGRAHALTGPHALSARDQVAQLSGLLRRPLVHAELSEREALDRWRARYPEPVAQAMLERVGRQVAGAKETVTQDVLRVTGRPPATFGAWARRHLADFR